MSDFDHLALRGRVCLNNGCVSILPASMRLMFKWRRRALALVARAARQPKAVSSIWPVAPQLQDHSR